jgi:hypothetical protein
MSGKRGFIMSKMNNSESFNSSRFENSTTVMRRLAKAGSVALVSTGLLFGGNALANADEVVVVPGAGDPSGQGYVNQLQATGQLGPNDTVHIVEYPAEIGPFVGSMPMNQSVDIAVVNGRNVLADANRAAAPGERVVIRGYSEGGVPAAILANERSGGAPVEHGTVVFDGAPVSDMSVFNSQNGLVQQFLPMVTDMINVPIHNRAPAGSIVRSSEQDVWAVGGGPDLGKVISQGMDTLMGPAHAVQDTRAGGFYVVVGEDGIEHQIFYGVGTGGMPLGPVGMGGEYAQPAPAPVPAEAPAPAPYVVSPLFHSTIHVEPTAPAKAQADNSRQESVVTKTSGTRKDGTARKTVVRSHVSMNFSTHK